MDRRIDEGMDGGMGVATFSYIEWLHAEQLLRLGYYRKLTNIKIVMEHNNQICFTPVLQNRAKRIFPTAKQSWGLFQDWDWQVLVDFK